MPDTEWVLEAPQTRPPSKTKFERKSAVRGFHPNIQTLAWINSRTQRSLSGPSHGPLLASRVPKIHLGSRGQEHRRGLEASCPRHRGVSGVQKASVRLFFLFLSRSWQCRLAISKLSIHPSIHRSIYPCLSLSIYLMSSHVMSIDFTLYCTYNSITYIPAITSAFPPP